MPSPTAHSTGPRRPIDHNERSPPGSTAREVIPADCAARCPYCGSASGVVHVHGHGQCASCGVNREPCCQP